MKIVLDIQEKEKNLQNDIIVYDKDLKKWVVKSKQKYLEEEYIKFANIELTNKGLQEQIDSIENEIKTLKSNINTKLEQYHNVLKTLTGNSEE